MKRDMQLIKFINYGGAQPSSFTEYPSYKKKPTLVHQRQPRAKNAATLVFQFK